MLLFVIIPFRMKQISVLFKIAMKSHLLFITLLALLAKATRANGSFKKSNKSNSHRSLPKERKERYALVALYTKSDSLFTQRVIRSLHKERFTLFKRAKELFTFLSKNEQFA